MGYAPDIIDATPAMTTEQTAPTGVALVTLINENLALNFRQNLSPQIDLPSLWRLSKYVVYEQGPLLLFRYREPVR